jgi:hypothetical protein
MKSVHVQKTFDIADESFVSFSVSYLDIHPSNFISIYIFCCMFVLPGIRVIPGKNVLRDMDSISFLFCA